MEFKNLCSLITWLLLGLSFVAVYTDAQQYRRPIPNNKDKETNDSSTAKPNVSKRSVSCFSYHTIKAGDTCWDIQNHYGVSLARLYELNQGLNCDLLPIGGELCVATNQVSRQKSTAGGCASYWVVGNGDICYNIAQILQISLSTLLSLNPDLDCYNLKIGQQLCTKAANRNVGFSKRSVSELGTNESGCTRRHLVNKGESCWTIANANGLDLADFLKLNPSLNCDPLYAGDKVCVAKTTEMVDCFKKHTVRSGDTCYEIAKLHSITISELLARNPGLDCDLLQIDRNVCVSKKTPATKRAPVPNLYKKGNPDKPSNQSKNRYISESGTCSNHFVALRQTSCSEISKLVGLRSKLDIEALNPSLDCKKKITSGQHVCIKIPDWLQCTVFYAVNTGDTEESINSQFGLQQNALKLLNEENIKNVAVGQLICVQKKVKPSIYTSPLNCL